jgi:hypothetical protein
MTNSTPAGVVISYDNGAGTPVDITAHVMEINDIEIESLTEEMHSFGKTWEESKPVGIARMSDIELSGLYDDVAATGPDALFAGRAPETPATATRTITFTWRTGKTTSVETYLKSYTRSPDRNELTKYSAVLQPTGVVTEV